MKREQISHFRGSVLSILIKCKLYLSDKTLLRRIREHLNGVAKKGGSYIEAGTSISNAEYLLTAIQMMHEFPLSRESLGCRTKDGDPDNVTVTMVCHHLQSSTAYVVVIGRRRSRRFRSLGAVPVM